MNIVDAEIIIPAYTCVVVANAVVKSGNIPVFIDSSEDDFNMNLEELKHKVTDKTKAIILTSMFGYPVDIGKFEEIKKNLSSDIIIIQDCALAFGTKYRNEPVSNFGDFAIYGLNAGKQICTLQGGVATTNNSEYYDKLKEYRDTNFKSQSLLKKIWWLLYIIGLRLGFTKTIFDLTYMLSERTRLLDGFLKYYSEDKIDLPEDYNELFSGIQARIGLVQLEKYDEILSNRKRISELYNENLHDSTKIKVPPVVDGATYSHYVIRVQNRPEFLKLLSQKKINCGVLFDYSLPHLNSYRKYAQGDYKVSRSLAETVVNLPNYPGLNYKDQMYIIDKIKEIN
jgi:dTDP-4-amino-4,6-dideoxygalactose transaminase